MWDVYVWVGRDVVAVRDFFQRFVRTDPADPNGMAFQRVYLNGDGTADDLDRLADLRWGGARTRSVTVYMRAAHHDGATVTVTDQGEFTLGLSLDDPTQSPDLEQEAAELIASLRDRYRAIEGRAGVELAPALSGATTSEPSPLVS